MPCDPEVLRQVPLFTLLDDEETAVLAAQVELRQFKAEFVTDLAQQADDAMRRNLEARGIEDLRSDMRMQADELQAAAAEDASRGFFRGAAGE